MTALTWLWLGCGAVETAPPPAPVPTAPPVVDEPAVAVKRAIAVKPAERDPARWADARCNDGTPFAYLIRPGAADTWVINLAGGFFCEDERAPCADRKRRLTTTVPEADGAPTARMKSRGLFHQAVGPNPDFHDAHHVDAHYCSSDLWLGDRPGRQTNTASPSEGWYFAGRRNVEVLLDALERLHGLDPSTHRVLLVGTSAGGAGVVGNLDTVVARWPEMAAEGRLKVLLDGSWIPPQPPEVKLPRADRWGAVHRGCAAAAGADGSDPLDCIYGPRWWPYVRDSGVDVLVQISGQDKTQLPVFGVDTAEERTAWQLGLKASLADVPWVFSGGQPYHVVGIDGTFNKGPEGASFQEVLGRFWAGRAPEQVFFRYPENATR